MNPSAVFIRRPVATTLLTIGIALAGIAAFTELPVAPLPKVDAPAISVSASLPGAPRTWSADGSGIADARGTGPKGNDLGTAARDRRLLHS